MRTLNLVRGLTARRRRPPAVRSQVHSLQLPLEQNPDVGWKPHHLFRGPTPVVKSMGCHVSILDPGKQPHDPHRHAEEEILAILDGEAELVLEDAGGENGLSRHRVRRGTFAYYPSDFAHTINNASAAPVTYAMFKWTTDHRQDQRALGHRLVALAPETEPLRDSPRGYAMDRVLDGETRCLGHLHAHVTTMKPGAGYPAHVDPYDVGILVLDGVVETLGRQAGPHSVVFYAAGEPHGMRNVGDGTATYLVFEFHPRRTRARRLVDRIARRLRRVSGRG
jgi:quercetin dioxygenase-like cupin family protein